MIKIKRKIEGDVNCLDSQSIEYDIHYECILKCNLCDFNQVRKLELYRNNVESIIMEYVSNYKMKYFIKKVYTELERERNKWIDINRTNKEQDNIHNIIMKKISNEASDFNFSLKKFNWFPNQICHSLYAALG